MQSDEVTRQQIQQSDTHQAPHDPYSSAQHSPDEEHIHLPPPSIWPATMALGIAVAAMGLVFTIAVSFLGLLLALWAMINWIQELRHESH